MEILFDGIPLDKVSTSMTINAPAAVLLAMYIVVAKRRGIDPKLLQAPSKTTSSKSMSRGAPISTHPALPCG